MNLVVLLRLYSRASRLCAIQVPLGWNDLSTATLWLSFINLVARPVAWAFAPSVASHLPFRSRLAHLTRWNSPRFIPQIFFLWFSRSNTFLWFSQCQSAPFSTACLRWDSFNCVKLLFRFKESTFLRNTLISLQQTNLGQLAAYVFLFILEQKYSLCELLPIYGSLL